MADAIADGRSLGTDREVIGPIDGREIVARISVRVATVEGVLGRLLVGMFTHVDRGQAGRPAAVINAAPDVVAEAARHLDMDGP